MRWMKRHLPLLMIVTLLDVMVTEIFLNVQRKVIVIYDWIVYILEFALINVLIELVWGEFVVALFVILRVIFNLAGWALTFNEA